MKKQYQISEKRAVEKFKSWAANNNVPIQFTFPTADIAVLAQTSLGDLLRSVGKMFIETGAVEIASRTFAGEPQRSGEFG